MGQARDGGIGGIGDVESPVGEDPGHPGVDGPEPKGPCLRLAAVGVVGVEQPLELGGGHVGGEPKALGLEQEAVDDRAEVLPAKGRTERQASGGIPDDRRGALIGDPDSIDGPAGGQGTSGSLEDRLFDGECVELHLAGVR